jgi:uncharacterized protein (TIGR00369 family)
MEDLAKLKDAVRISMSSELEGVARRKMKRKLLDALDAKYAFDLPPTLLDQEFSAIWNNVTTEMKAASKTFEDEGTTEAEARDEYLKIATRRVRLGLVLAEIGENVVVILSTHILPEVEQVCNRVQIIHKGHLVFADTLGGVGTFVNLPEGKGTTTVESSTKFIGSAKVGSTVTGESTPLHKGRTTMVWQTNIRNDAGKLCAVVTQTQLVIPG